ncbi:hypothetical protein PHMEG_00035861, partial [Phytophthora megakarya]
MPPTTPLTGDYLLLFPEDVKRKVETPFYGLVVATTRSSVRVDSVTTTVPGSYTVSKSIASKRQVPSEEAEGDQPGTWLRKGVFVRSGSFHYYGQVVNQEGNRIRVATYLGEKECALQQIVGEVYPVVAVIMGSQRWSVRQWAQSTLEEVHDRLLDAILKGHSGAPVTAEGLSALVPGLKDRRNVVGLSALVPGLKDRRNVVAEWLDPASGASQTMSLEHVVRYVFYVDGKRAIPAN